MKMKTTSLQSSMLFSKKIKGETVGYYFPHLLSFLLHGAYLNADVLEAFVLDKYSLHFGHKRYWFLSAWCLRLYGEQQKAHNQLPHQIYYQNSPHANDNDHSPFIVVAHCILSNISICDRPFFASSTYLSIPWIDCCHRQIYLN